MAENNHVDLTCYETSDFLYDSALDVLEPQIVNGIDLTCYESTDFLRIHDRYAPEVVLEPQIVNAIDDRDAHPEVREVVNDIEASSLAKNLKFDRIAEDDTVSLHGGVKLSDLIVKADSVKIDFDKLYENEKAVGVVVKDGYQLSVETGPKTQVRLTCVKSIMEGCSKLGKSPLVTWLAVHYFDRVLSASDDIQPEWPADCIVIASNTVEDAGVNRESLHERFGVKNKTEFDQALNIRPPLTPFTFLGYYCEKAGISLGMALENLPIILEILKDPQFLGVKAWELCLGFVLSVGFEEASGWNNDSHEDLFYKADKEKVELCYKRFRSDLSVGTGSGM